MILWLRKRMEGLMFGIVIAGLWSVQLYMSGMHQPHEGSPNFTDKLVTIVECMGCCWGTHLAFEGLGVMQRLTRLSVILRCTLR